MSSTSSQGPIQNYDEAGNVQRGNVGAGYGPYAVSAFGGDRTGRKNLRSSLGRDFPAMATYSTLCHQDNQETLTCPAQDRDHPGSQAKNLRHPLTA